MPPHLTEAARLLKAGRPQDAIAPLQRAAAMSPGNAAVLHDLGLACLEAGRPAEAAAALRGAIAAKPGYASAHFRLGVALERLGETAAAVRAYDRATELLPSFTEAWFRAGALVFTLGHRAEAIGCFRRAAASGPKTGFGRLGAARALLAEERDADAERVLRQTLALDRDNAMALDLLGNLLADAGRFEEARACFARAIAAAPLMAGAYYDLVRCRRVTAADGDLAGEIEAALATPGLDDAQRVRVHLARGKVADDLGDPARAMRAFDAADAIRGVVQPFDAGLFDAGLRRVAAWCEPALFARTTELAARGPGEPHTETLPATPGAKAPDTETPDRTPILIFGLPRSGTTLVEQIVSAHRDVAAGGELNFWNERGATAMQTGASQVGVSQVGASQVGPSQVGGQPGPLGEGTTFLAQAAADYLAVLRGIGPEAARVTDKMPFNVIWAGLIHLACPGATLIYCRRNPIDTALSIHQTHFNPNLAFPTGGEALVSYVRSIDRLAAHWRAVLPADRFIAVEYEALTADPEPEIRRLVAACGLAWDAACLHPELNARVVRTPSKWQARQAINRGSVARWRRYEPWLGALAGLLP